MPDRRNDDPGPPGTKAGGPATMPGGAAAAAPKPPLGETLPSLLAMTACPRCKTSTPIARFCTACGTSLAPRRFCSECGAKLKPGAAACEECGVPVA